MKRVEGFTLLEVILALGLTSLIVLGAAQFLQQGARVWGQGEKIIVDAESEMVALNFIRKMLVKAKAVDWLPQESIPKARMKVFLGQDDEFHFAAPLPVHNGQNIGLYLFSFSVQSVKEAINPALVASYRSINWESLEETLAEDVEREVLMENVASLQVEYYGDLDLTDGDENPEWHNEWEEAQNFPLALRLTIARVQGEGDEDIERMEWQQVVMRLPHKRLR